MTRTGKIALLLTVIVIVALLLGPARRQQEQQRRNRALFTAARGNDTRAVTTLLAQGADPNVQDETDCSGPCSSLWSRVLRRLRGEPLRAETHPTVLLAALDWHNSLPGGPGFPPENTALVKALLDKGAAVNSEWRGGITPLMLAIMAGKRDTAALLLDRGADIRKGYPALLFSAGGGTRGGNDTLVNLLLDRGADINQRDKRGSTALTEAAANQHQTIVKTLLRRHAKVNLKNGRGMTALGLARRAEHPNPAIIKMLEDAGGKE